MNSKGTAEASAGNLYKIDIDYLYVTANFTNRYEATNNTLFEVQSNTATVLTVDIDPTSKNVQVGDEYDIGWRVDTAIEQFFTDYAASLNITGTIQTISKYTVRDFSEMKGIQFIRDMAQLAGAHWWLGKGRTFRFRTSFASSGVTFDETQVMADQIEISKPEANFLKTARITGMPEVGDIATKTSGSESGPRSILAKLFHVRNKTELQSIVDTWITRLDTESTKPNILLPIKLQSADVQRVDIGQTVNVTLDVDADTVDEIDESNIIIHSIEESQEVGELVQTTIQVGFYPMDRSEEFKNALGLEQIRTNIFTQGRDDIYLERYRNKEGATPPIGDLSQIQVRPADTLQKTDELTNPWEWYPDPDGNPTHGITIGSDPNIPGEIDAVGGIDFYVSRAGVPKLQGGDVTISLGTGAVNEDIDGFGDIDISAGTGDLDMDGIEIAHRVLTSITDGNMQFVTNRAEDDVRAGQVGTTRNFTATNDCYVLVDIDIDVDLIFGANAFTLVDNGAGSAVLSVTDGLVLNATNDPQLQIQEDANNYMVIGWQKAADAAVYQAVDGGSLTHSTFIHGLRVTDDTISDYIEISHGGTNSLIKTSSGNILVYPLNKLAIKHNSTQAVLGSNKAFHIEADEDGTPQDVFYVDWDGQIYADLGAGTGHVTAFDDEDDLQLVSVMDMTDRDTWHSALKGENNTANLGNMLSLGFGTHKKAYERIQHLEMENNNLYLKHMKLDDELEKVKKQLIELKGENLYDGTN